ncbi:MAG: Peptidase-C39-2 domain-containing protein [Lachnoclostridium sp.]|jgi:hypothetical protein
MIKKIIAIILSMVFLFGGLNTLVSASVISTNDIDTIDMLIAAGTYLNSTTEPCISGNTYLKQVVPLYNNESKIVAYYVSFTPTGYAVVNNNINNPTVIEFGKGTNETIEDILNNDSNPHIIYNNPVSIYNANNTSLTVQGKNSKDIYDYYPDLKSSNSSLAKQHKEVKNAIMKNRAVIQGDGDYGFIDLGDMPSGKYTSDTILYATSTDWAIMDEFNSIADNHCGATAVTNIALYYAKRGYSKLKINSRLDTFKAVHKIVGNGPVMTIAGSAKEYFSDRGYTLKYSSVGDFSGIKSATTSDRPCGILLADGLFSWHWILSVGWREYTNGGNYLRIMDGWYDTVDRYYKINSGSLWISATEYWVSQ